MTEQLSFLDELTNANPQLKIGKFTCQCGCGLVFEREYSTKRFRYFNRAHAQRAYRARCKLKES